MDHFNVRHRLAQRGVALITALLVIALVTAAAVAMASRQQLDIRRTANILQRDQAYVYAEGAEIMARAVLAKDDLATDHREEDWGKGGVSIPFQGGLLTGTLEDLQGRFNLNNVVQKNGTVSLPDVDRLIRLLQILKNKKPDDEHWKKAEPSDLAHAVVDWIDPDNNVTSPGGAEDSDYLQTDRPYRTANAPMAASSELLLVRGFTPAIYRDVAPYVTALSEHTLINVNTAKLELLRALDPDINCVDVTKLGRNEEVLTASVTIDSAKVKPTIFPDAQAFLRDPSTAACKFPGFIHSPPLPAVAGAAPPEDPAHVLSVTTNFFQVNAYAEVGPDDHRVKVKLYSVLQRKNGKIATLSRAQGFE